MKITIDDAHFEYLRVQKGNLDNLTGDRIAWHKAYEEGLHAQLATFRDYLPEKCDRLLDVGSGLGGIDILVRRLYQERGQDPHVHLLDGNGERPVVDLHRVPFCSMRVAEDFQVRNGLKPDRFGYWPAENFGKPFGSSSGAPDTGQYDLILSSGAWCFHFPPSEYLNVFRNGWIHDETIAILDVRNNKPEWRRQLENVFDEVWVAKVTAKWTRIVYRRRARPYGSR